ncbi:hypothetical protein E4P82_17855 [Candidatus Competibacter phosphatis]|uniref:UDP-glucose/GDP-mannose dehydrogenase dimerisation domain-containing protein n=1 Tax=Candidatus Competibacter phosphatis TaxID=221280 RepID=A0ABX1TNA5_9GAMM|nr:hypothetical protein [Candidatus Competibacter phosphatis]
MLDIVQSGRLSSNEYYLAAGMPYGGGCLPKDIDALLSQMHQELPVLQAIQRSNQLQSRAGRAAHFFDPGVRPMGWRSNRAKSR